MKVQHLNYPVWHLQNSDFGPSGNIIENKQLDKNKATIIFVQMERCGHCVKAKPEFQRFADKNSDKYNMCTISCHGADDPQPGEKELCARVDKLIPNFAGYPTIIAFKNGRYYSTNNIGRDVSSMEQFARSV